MCAEYESEELHSYIAQCHGDSCALVKRLGHEPPSAPTSSKVFGATVSAGSFLSNGARDGRQVIEALAGVVDKAKAGGGNVVVLMPS